MCAWVKYSNYDDGDDGFIQSFQFLVIMPYFPLFCKF